MKKEKSQESLAGLLHRRHELMRQMHEVGVALIPFVSEIIQNFMITKGLGAEATEPEILNYCRMHIPDLSAEDVSNALFELSMWKDGTLSLIRYDDDNNKVFTLKNGID